MNPYKKMMIGAIFMFDFNLGSFDVLPDIVAYALFFFGLSELMKENEHYQKARMYTIPLMILSVLELFGFGVNVQVVSFTDVDVLVWAVIIFGVVMGILFMYNLLFGVQEEAKRQEIIQIDDQASLVWKLFLASQVMILVTFMLPIIFVVAFIINLIQFILLIKLMNDASLKLRIDSDGVVL